MLAPALNSVFPRPDGQSNPFHQHTQSFQSSARLSVPATASREGFDGFRVFEQLLDKGYQALHSDTLFKPAQADSSADAATVAERILGFIEQRLVVDAAGGASREQLQGRVEAGLEGFIQGFEDARRQLDDLGLLSGPVADKIAATYDAVLEGVAQLREKYVAAEPAPRAGSEAAIDRPLSAGSSAASAFAEYGYARRNSFSFELQTADGDTVRIRASAGEAFSAHSQFAAGGSGAGQLSAQAGGAAYSHSQRFDLSIDGELDAGELAAINDLLGKVNDLSQQFFSGDLEGAFNSAVNIGYDSTEIVGFALNLKRVEVQRASAAYQQFQAPDAYAGPALAERLAPLGDFSHQLLEALQLASPFEQPQQLLRDLADRVGQLNDGRTPVEEKRFGPFVGHMLDSLARVES